MNAFEPKPFAIVRETEPPGPPPTLDATGAALWCAVLARRRFTAPDLLAVLEHACASHQRAEQLRQIISIEGAMLATGDDGLKANPLLSHELQCRSLAARLLCKLLPAEDRPLRMGRPTNRHG